MAWRATVVFDLDGTLADTSADLIAGGECLLSGARAWRTCWIRRRMLLIASRRAAGYAARAVTRARSPTLRAPRRRG